MWNDIKIIIIVILLFVAPYFILLLIMANPEATFGIIISTILFCLIFRVIAKIIFTRVSNIKSIIKYYQSNKTHNDIIDIEKWRNDFIKGKQVMIGLNLIQFKNNVLIINGENFFTEEIKELEFNSQISSVIKSTIGLSSHWENSEYISDFTPSYTSTQVTNFVTKTKEITLEEYDEIMEECKLNIKYYGTAKDSSRYEFKKTFYISITLNNGTFRIVPLGHEISKSQKFDGQKEEELKEQIKEIKFVIKN